MSIIYEPTGKAAEYAPLAANLYTGCTHGCLYCFAPDTPAYRANGIDRTRFHTEVAPKKNVLERFQVDAGRLARQGDDREILLSFMTDPYQPLEMEEGITREAIKILIENNLRFTILTKGGNRASRDFDLLEDYPKCSFGTTLTFDSVLSSYHWEPGAPSSVDRIDAMLTAHYRGIETWVSLEPVIDPQESIRIIDIFSNAVDHWKIGKINYFPQIEKRVDWAKFREDVKQLLDGLGADYYLKRSLFQ